MGPAAATEDHFFPRPAKKKQNGGWLTARAQAPRRASMSSIPAQRFGTDRGNDRSLCGFALRTPIQLIAIAMR